MTMIKHIEDLDPYNTKTKRVPWNQFDSLLNCFRKDTRLFIVTEKDSGGDAHNHEMSMENIIDFWDGGIAHVKDRSNMILILEAASKLEIYDTVTELGWTIKRVA